jgi:hypothetical protein
MNATTLFLALLIQQPPSDAAVVRHHYRQFSKMSERMLLKGLGSEDVRVQFAARWVYGDRGLRDKYAEVAPFLTMESDMIRQAARRYMVGVAADKEHGREWRKMKRPRIVFTDFGPFPGSSLTEAMAAAELWSAWFDEPMKEMP